MEQARNKPPSETYVKETNNNNGKLSVSDNEDLQNSYFKIRVLIRQLRPHFIQVLQTSDFRNCKAAREIRKNLKLVLDLYKQMIVEAEPPLSLVRERQTLVDDHVFGEQSPDKFQEGKEAELLETEHCGGKSTDIKHPIPSSGSEWKVGEGQFRGSYVVGGSVFGWNFITYGGSKPVYYGLTKESYLSRQMKS